MFINVQDVCKKDSNQLNNVYKHAGSVHEA